MVKTYPKGNTKEENNMKEGKELMTAIIKAVAEEDLFFDYVNGVLSSEKVMGEEQVYYTWGEVVFIPAGTPYGTKTSTLKKVIDFTVENGQIIFFLSKENFGEEVRA